METAYQQVRRGADPVRDSSPESANRAIDRRTVERIEAARRAAPAELDCRIARLDPEWDIERVLETNAATLGFLGTCLGIFGSRKWFAVPLVVTGFLFQHAVQGWCPPVPLFRRLGVRTRKEIDREKTALQIIRGDFRDFTPTGSPDDARRALDRVA
jgi:hypothetical protein